jgi:hypothetical protein
LTRTKNMRPTRSNATAGKNLATVYTDKNPGSV